MKLTHPTPFFTRLEPLLKIIECALISTIIKDEKPFSLLIAAAPESGKTSAMKLYKDLRTVLYMTDVTAFGLSKYHLQSFVTGEKKTLMIPDLLTPLSKQSRTRRGFIAFLNNLLEEGVSKMATYAFVRHDDTDVKANLVTALTKHELRDGRHRWTHMGFLSRCLVFSYSYSEDSVDAILDSYSLNPSQAKNRLPKVKVKIPKRNVKVDLSYEMGGRLTPIAKEIGKQYEAYGIRAKIHLRSLLKSIAYRNGRSEVSEEDFRELLELVEFMNFDYKEI